MKTFSTTLFVIIGGVGLAVVALLLLSILPIDQTKNNSSITENNIVEVDTDLILVGPSDEDSTISVWQSFIVNPNTGDKQAVRIYVPEGENLPAVVLIPGGVGNGADFEKANGENPSDAVTVAQAGFVTAVYDPLGRGESEGEINFQGFEDQDGLAEVIKLVIGMSQVDQSNVGLASFSYGVTAAAGVLARYPELGIKFWSDWEGPSSRSYTNPNCSGSMSRGDLPTPGSFSCSDDEHWLGREAAVSIEKAKVDYYWRIQQVDDHVQDTYGHTVEMVNNAIANSEIPHVRLNNMPENTQVTEETVEPAPNGPKLITDVIPHLLEMAAM